MKRQSPASERGAILVYAALTVFVWLGLATFVVDYGVLWASRHQAQNAADAGALAGALARAYDDFDDPPAALGPTVLSATASRTVTASGAPPSSRGRVLPVPAGSPGASALRARGRLSQRRKRERKRAAVVRADHRRHVAGRQSHGERAGHDRERDELSPAVGDSRRVDRGRGRRQVHEVRRLHGRAAGGASRRLHPAGCRRPGDRLQVRHKQCRSSRSRRDAAADIGDGSDEPDIPRWIRSSRAGCCRSNRRRATPQAWAPATASRSRSGLRSGGADACPAAPDFGGLDRPIPWRRGTRATASIDGSCAPACAPLSPRLVAVAVFDTEVFQYRRAMRNWAACPPGRTCTPCPAAGAVRVDRQHRGPVHRQRRWFERHADQLPGPGAVRPRRGCRPSRRF